MSPSASSSSRRPRRTISWSSRRNTRIVTRPSCPAARRSQRSYHRGMTSGDGPHSLRRLIDAIVTVGSDLDLPAMLQRIIEAAVDLVDAEHGALGVLDDTRTRLAQFITV